MKSRQLIVSLMRLQAVACGGGEEATATSEPRPSEKPTEPAAEVVLDPCAPTDEGSLTGVDPRGVTFDWWHQHSRASEEQLMEMVAEFNATNACGITVNATNQDRYDDIRPLPVFPKRCEVQRWPRLAGPSTMRVANR